jgi:Transposase, Mutator family
MRQGAGWTVPARSRSLPATNLLERSLGEVKRRTKVIGRFPVETSCLTLVWAVLDLYITASAACGPVEAVGSIPADLGVKRSEKKSRGARPADHARRGRRKGVRHATSYDA